jgi:CRP/FNR family transcriptional regulator, cyclic AMP receptor protein
MTSVSPADKHGFLSRSAFFKALTAQQLEQLTARLVERRFTDRQVVFRRGEPGSSMMIVLEGRVRIGVTSAEGREVLLSIVEPGQLFGELALLDGQPRSADASALGPCRLLALDRRDFLAVLRQSANAAIRMCELVSERLRATNAQLEGALFLSVEARLARLLLALRRGPGGCDGRIELCLSQGDLARLIGASREEVNRHLCRWVADGMIARDGRALVIRDRTGLAAIAGQPISQEKFLLPVSRPTLAAAQRP